MPRRLLVHLCAAGVLLASCTPSAPVSVRGPHGAVAVGTLSVERIDPSTATAPQEMLVARTACDSLVSIDPESGQPAPGLAATWSFSEDGKRLTLSLRRRLKFQDGEAVTAATVRDGLVRALGEGGGRWTGLLGAVAGVGTADVGASIAAVGPLELKFELSRPDLEVLTALAHPALAPLAPSSSSEVPICVGPFRITREGDGGARLVRVPRGRDDTSGRGGLSVIRFVPYPSMEEAFEAFRRKEVQVAPVPVNRVADAEALGRSYQRGGNPAITYLAFAPGDPATADPRLRRAVSLATDRLLLIDAVFGDQREPATRWLREEGAAPQPCESSAGKVSDPEKAKAALAEGGIDPAGVRLSLIHDGDSDRLVAQALSVKLRDVLGVQVEPKPVTAAELATTAAAKPAGSLWLLGSTPQIPTTTEMLQAIFGSQGSRNLTGSSDPQVDAAIASALAQRSPAGKWAKAQEAEGMVCEKMLGIPLWWGANHWVVEVAQLRTRHLWLDQSGDPVLRDISIR